MARYIKLKTPLIDRFLMKLGLKAESYEYDNSYALWPEVDSENQRKRCSNELRKHSRQ
ncbi:hypothetical protein [Pyrococcus yayanosii]|uniref:hypothetical protein n=1 Tax=Pyrococcus yayanosii TaxID=1008460 RepID=UPI0013054806|nr:hypothetical protein [Pyrococcus yayanosii]